MILDNYRIYSGSAHKHNLRSGPYNRSESFDYHMIESTFKVEILYFFLCIYPTFNSYLDQSRSNTDFLKSRSNTYYRIFDQPFIQSNQLSNLFLSYKNQAIQIFPYSNITHLTSRLDWIHQNHIWTIIIILVQIYQRHITKLLKWMARKQIIVIY